MLGMADLLLDTPLTPEQLTYAKAAKTSGETLLSLIEEILDFSKIEAGKLDLEARPFAPAAMIEEAVELMAPRAQGKGIEIASFIDDAYRRRWLATWRACGRFYSISSEMPSSSPKKAASHVIVEPGSRRERNSFLKCATPASALKKEDLARIFLDFEQADGSLTRKFGGTGLGLAISKRIVERMDGHISERVRLERVRPFADQRAVAPGA